MVHPGVRFARSRVPALAVVLAMVALASLTFRGVPEASAAPLCGVVFDLPSGNAAELRPGDTAVFSYSVYVTVAEVSAIDLQVFSGNGSGLNVSIQPANSSIPVSPSRDPVTMPVFGSISVGVPESFDAGTYVVSGLGAVASCSVPQRDGSVSTIQGRDGPRELTLTVVAPPATSTPEPRPTETPVPPPAICDPDLDLMGSTSLNVSPGETVSVPFHASIVARRILRADLRVEAENQGGMTVTMEPLQSSFTFDPRSTETALRSFSGTIVIKVPRDQPPGSYSVSGIAAVASCQGLDASGSPTTFSAQSGSSSISVTIDAPTPTPTSTATPTPTPSPTQSPSTTPTASATPTATTIATATTTGTPTAAPSVTASPTQTPTARSTSTSTSTVTAAATTTATVTPTPRSIVRPLATATQASGESTVTPTVEDQQGPPTATATEAATSVVVDVVSEDSVRTVLDWNESRQVIEAESERGSRGRSLAGLLSALLVAGGGYGAWRSRGRRSG